MHPVLCVLFVLGFRAVEGAEFSEGVLRGIRVPERPSTRLLDEVRMLSEQQQARLAKHLVDLADETGVEVFLGAVVCPPARGIEPLAREVAKQWVHSELGLVFDDDLGGKQLSFLSSVGVYDDVACPVQYSDFDETIAARENRDDPAENHVRVVEQVSERLASRITLVEDSRGAGWRGLAWMFPACLGGGLIFLWISLRERPRSSEFTPGPAGLPGTQTRLDPMDSCRFFSTTGVAERLGGAFGGGSPIQVRLPGWGREVHGDVT